MKVKNIYLALLFLVWVQFPAICSPNITEEERMVKGVTRIFSDCSQQ